MESILRVETGGCRPHCRYWTALTTQAHPITGVMEMIEIPLISQHIPFSSSKSARAHQGSYISASTDLYQEQ